MADEITLQAHIEALFQKLEERFDAYVEWHMRDHERIADQVRLDAAAIDARLAGMNELRQQITSERSLFVTRDMLDSRTQPHGGIGDRLEELLAGVNNRIDSLATRLSAAEQLRANLDGRIAMIGTFFLAVSIFAQIIISVVANNIALRK